MSRPSPADHAKNHPGETLTGGDSNLWTSTPNVNGVYRWVRVKVAPKKSAKKIPKKSAKGKAKATSKKSTKATPKKSTKSKTKTKKITREAVIILVPFLLPYEEYSGDQRYYSTGNKALDKTVVGRIAKDHTRVKQAFEYDLKGLGTLKFEYYPPGGKLFNNDFLVPKNTLGVIALRLSNLKASETLAKLTKIVLEVVDSGPDTWMEGDLNIIQENEVKRTKGFPKGTLGAELLFDVERIQIIEYLSSGGLKDIETVKINSAIPVSIF